jgi:hypothetical protein
MQKLQVILLITREWINPPRLNLIKLFILLPNIFLFDQSIEVSRKIYRHQQSFHLALDGDRTHNLPIVSRVPLDNSFFFLATFNAPCIVQLVKVDTWKSV